MTPSISIPIIIVSVLILFGMFIFINLRRWEKRMDRWTFVFPVCARILDRKYRSDIISVSIHLTQSVTYLADLYMNHAEYTSYDRQDEIRLKARCDLVSGRIDLMTDNAVVHGDRLTRRHQRSLQEELPKMYLSLEDQPETYDPPLRMFFKDEKHIRKV